MARPNQSKISRKRYSDEYKKEALALASKIGVKAAAAELGVNEALLYNWRAKAERARSQSEIERAQAAEIARLKRQLAGQKEELAILEKAAAYFAKGLK